jgi:hypothetical protein
MATEATVREYDHARGRGSAVTADGTPVIITQSIFDRKGPGTPTLEDVKEGTKIVIDRVGVTMVWRTV